MMRGWRGEEGRERGALVAALSLQEPHPPTRARTCVSAECGRRRWPLPSASGAPPSGSSPGRHPTSEAARPGLEKAKRAMRASTWRGRGEVSEVLLLPLV